jgi:hypothetical protein
MQFQKAQRRKAKLRLAITGPSGAGKTWGALKVARGLGGKIAVVDTERGSASLYTNLAEFDVLELVAPYSPERFIGAIQAAEKAGYDVLVIDSASHEWNGVGGCLELVDHVAAAKFRGNSWSAWNEVTPRHRAFLDAMLRSNMHIIATMRSKTETAQTEENGRKKVVKLGMKSEQRDGIEYEFTTVLDLTHDGHHALASKDRTGLFVGDPQPLTEETGRRLLEWLESGAEPAPLAEEPPTSLPQGVITGRQLQEAQDRPDYDPEPPLGSNRLSSFEANRQGLGESIKKFIDGAKPKELDLWEKNFDRNTGHLPVSWLEPLRDRIQLRREEFAREAEGEANVAEAAGELDEAFRATTMAGSSPAALAGSNAPHQAAR